MKAFYYWIDEGADPLPIDKDVFLRLLSKEEFVVKVVHYSRGKVARDIYWTERHYRADEEDADIVRQEFSRYMADAE